MSPASTADDGINLSSGQVTPARVVAKTSSAKISATSTAARSSLVASTSNVTFGSSSSNEQSSASGHSATGVYNSLPSSLSGLPVHVEIDESLGNTSCKGTGENCTSSSSPQSAVNSVILPTLIEAPGATPTQLLIPVPDTRAGSDQQALSQQLSFPNVSVLGPSTVPVSSSCNDDPLRTPPRPFIEDHTSKTGNNQASIALSSHDAFS